MLRLIPRHHFAKLEAEHGTGRKARSFARWSQVVHLLARQLTARASLRDGIDSLKARLRSLYHLGVLLRLAKGTFTVKPGDTINGFLKATHFTPQDNRGRKRFT